MDRTIWDCFEKQSGEQILLTSCGAELQELMRQMDIMIKNKKLEWEAELSTIQDSLAFKEKELDHSRSLLKQKHEEVGFLKQQIENYEIGEKCMVRNYKSQLDQLRSQMKDLKEAHENIQHDHAKRKETSKDKEEEMLIEIQQLQAALNEKQEQTLQHDRDHREWEKRNHALFQQIQRLEKKEQAWKVAQTRFKESSQKVDNLEGTGQSLLKKLEGELAHNKELIHQQESQIAELQSKTRELNKARRAAAGEKYRCQEEADKANCKLKVFAEEVNTLQAALSARESALKGSEHEIGDLTNIIEHLTASIHAKEKIIEAMQLRSPLKNKEDDLNQKVALLEATVENMMKTEKSLREKVKSLATQLQMSIDEGRKLNEVVNKSDCDKIVVVNEEIRRLRNNLEEMEASHSTRLCVIKAEVTNLSAQLHGRNINISRLGETCDEVDKQLKEESEQRHKLDEELQTAVANLKVLREQRKSDESVGVAAQATSADNSLVEAECQLTGLKKNYEAAVRRLEDENQRLQSKIAELKNDLFNKEKLDQGEAKKRVIDDATDVAEIEKDARIRNMCRVYERRIAALEETIHKMQEHNGLHRLSTPSSSIIVRSADSESDRVPALKTESNAVEKTPTSTKTFLRSIGIDPASLSSSTSSFTQSLADSLSEMQLHDCFGMKDEAFEELRIPSIEQFVSEEDAKVEQLESQIEQHIDDMRKAMDLAMEKYLK